jgi:hypothetical protein
VAKQAQRGCQLIGVEGPGPELGAEPLQRDELQQQGAQQIKCDKGPEACLCVMCAECNRQVTQCTQMLHGRAFIVVVSAEAIIAPCLTSIHTPTAKESHVTMALHAHAPGN